MYIIQKTRPDYDTVEYLAEEHGYSGPVYGYDKKTAVLYEDKSWAKYVIENNLKNHRHHRSVKDGGYGLEKWSVIEVSDKEAKEIEKFHQDRLEYQYECRKSDAERILRGTPFKVVRK